VKLLMALIDEGCKEELEVILTRAGVPGYTEIPHAVGMGTSGPRLGSAAFPKTSAIVLTFVEDGDVARVAAAVRDQCPAKGRVHLITWRVETLGA
jgi:hypothetical protein